MKSISEQFTLSGFVFAAMFSLFIMPNLLHAQNKTQLEEKRQQLLLQIKENNALLEKTQENKKGQINRYYVLRKQIKQRQNLIVFYDTQIKLTDTAIIQTEQTIEHLKEEDQQLKMEYGNMLRQAYRLQLNQSFWRFIFAANSFNDAFKRWQFFRQYQHFRHNQADRIRENQEELSKQMTLLQEQKEEKEALLADAKGQEQNVRSEMTEVNSLVKKLKTDEKKLLAKLKQQEKDHQQLNAAIEKIIVEEMNKNRRLASSPEGIAHSGSNASVGSDFASSRGSLPWPVSGKVIRPFGTVEHEDLPGIKTQNNGIDIKSSQSTYVKNAYAGEVVGVRYVNGNRNIIIIRHSDYYTVYANLELVKVSAGQKVIKGQILGSLRSNDRVLHFEVWHGKDKLNPARWLR